MGIFMSDTSGSMRGNGTSYNKFYDVVCIDNIGPRKFKVLQNGTAEGIPMYTNEILPLTIGKKYKAGKVGSYYLVKNDNGDTLNYDIDKFKIFTVKDWRNDQLDKILG